MSSKSGEKLKISGDNNDEFSGQVVVKMWLIMWYWVQFVVRAVGFFIVFPIA